MATLRWLGHACFLITFSDGTTVVTDPFDESVGYPPPRVEADIVTVSHGHHDHNALDTLTRADHVFREAGTHTARGVRVTGIPAFHDDVQGKKRGANLLFLIEHEGLRIAHLGDLGHALSAEQAALLGALDVLLLPVGGYYTIDAAQAEAVRLQLRPRVAVAMHFKTAYNAGMPIQEAGPFLALNGGSILPVDWVDVRAPLPAVLALTYGKD